LHGYRVLSEISESPAFLAHYFPALFLVNKYTLPFSVGTLRRFAGRSGNDWSPAQFARRLRVGFPKDSGTAEIVWGYDGPDSVGTLRRFSGRSGNESSPAQSAWRLRASFPKDSGTAEIVWV
jgi:hypothetical protein